MKRASFRLRFGIVLMATSAVIIPLAACGGRPDKAGLDTGMTRGFADGLPAIGSLKAPSVVTELELLGSAAIDNSSGVVLDDSVNFEAIMDASGSPQFQWSLYSFDPGPDPLVEVQVELRNRESADQPFVAVADFQDQVWDIHGPMLDDQLTLPLDSVSSQSAGGQVFIAVIAPEGSNFNVTRLVLRHLENDPPLADLQAESEQGDAPFMVNFDASGSTDADGSIVKYEWDALGDGTFEADTGATPTFSTTFASPTVVNAVVRITDDDGATSQANLQIRVTQGGNVPPIAVLESDVTEGDGEAGFEVNFTCDTSEDLDGTIDLYEWDLDGDTTSGTNGFELSSTTPDPQPVNYTVPGEINVRLRVTDNGGLQKTDAVKIISHGWAKSNIGSFPTFVANDFSLAVIGKVPAFSFRHDNSILTYARSATTFGDDQADWTLTEVSSTAAIAPTSLAQVANRPAIVYKNAAGLGYARSSTADGGQPGDWSTVDLAFSDARAPSLAVVDGKPAICLLDTGGASPVLSYAFSSSSTGAAAPDWSSIGLLQIHSVAVTSSMQLIGGKPAIAWVARTQNSDPFSLRFSSSLTAGGTQISDWQHVVVSGNVTDSLSRVSLAVLDGQPSISYWRNDSAAGGEAETLGLAQSSSADGLNAGDWLNFTIDPTGSAGEVTRLEVVDGLPMLLYRKNVPGNFLVLAESSTAAGSLPADWSSSEVANGIEDGFGAQGFDMADVNGYPALVYFDGNNGEVVYAIRF